MAQKREQERTPPIDVAAIMLCAAGGGMIVTAILSLLPGIGVDEDTRSGLVGFLMTAGVLLVFASAITAAAVDSLPRSSFKFKEKK
ncbi:hypothetical protein KW784_00160 [Candidatus Parcubacteria bacterium]|nr:hypothetical protein [Candidatus Parcubacteria bacterium]